MKHINPIIRPTMTAALIAACSLLSTISAQTVKDHIRKNPAYASCNYHIYPDSIDAQLTPAPKGKQPFYISHYGRHGSRYISNRSGFDEPFMMMMHADSLDELTPTGQRVLEVMKQIMNNSEDRWGELTEHGRRQHREIIRRMAERFPEVLGDTAHVEARSTIVPRCILSMGTAMMELAQINPKLRITMESSKRTMGYMNYQDRDLRKIQMSAQAKEAYNKFIANRIGNTRLMELIFKNPDIVNEIVDEDYFNYYLMKMGLFQVHTPLSKNTYITDIFHIDELYRLWEVDNAIWYIRHGACKLNGGTQPYSQRHLLRKIIADADSCIGLPYPTAQLRYGHETVLLPLVCLIGINGYDLETDDLEKLEAKGWWCPDVFPMGSNVQFIFYRSDPSDSDILFKVLLNEKEAKLPIRTDCAPYYHWRDFRKHYLKKIDAYKK